jgi:hypothetical protein
MKDEEECASRGWFLGAGRAERFGRRIHFVFTARRTLRNVDIFPEFGVRYSGENLNLMTAEMAFLRTRRGRIRQTGTAAVNR